MILHFSSYDTAMACLEAVKATDVCTELYLEPVIEILDIFFAQECDGML